MTAEGFLCSAFLGQRGAYAAAGGNLPFADWDGVGRFVEHVWIRIHREVPRASTGLELSNSTLGDIHGRNAKALLREIEGVASLATTRVKHRSSGAEHTGELRNFRGRPTERIGGGQVNIAGIPERSL